MISVLGEIRVSEKIIKECSFGDRKSLIMIDGPWIDGLSIYIL
jgi:hypothetical protein